MAKLGVVILAAGFGKRIRSVWDGPKGMILYKGQPILGYLFSEIRELGVELGVWIVSNQRDQAQYQELIHEEGMAAQVVSNGSRSAEAARGAVADLARGMEEMGEGDVLVLPCDTLMKGTLRLDELVEFAAGKDGVTVVVRSEKLEDIRGRFGNVRINKDDQVVEFVEKPLEPISQWAAAAVYYYPQAERKWVGEYLRQGGNPENPGRMIEYLLRQGRPVYGYRVQAGMIDVGTEKEMKLIDEDNHEGMVE